MSIRLIACTLALFATVPIARAIPPEDFDVLKKELQQQSVKVFALKRQQLVSEGPRGYLTSSDKLDLAQRELIQRENFYRERMFSLIAKRTGKTTEEVADKFAEMARRATGGAP